MNYCMRSIHGTKVHKDGQVYDYPIGVKAYVNSLCKSRLTCVDTIRKITKSIFAYERMVPLYVSEDILLFSVGSMRSFDGVWINYMEVLETKKEKGQILVYFLDGSSLQVNTSKNYLDTQIARCQEILAYMTEKSFESVYNCGLSIEI